ncbi:hypothetical protein HK405_008011 [Cladochytrium tenue]|nr:hypothetical protein HK405_008011 [Cladochytrium tenue]
MSQAGKGLDLDPHGHSSRHEHTDHALTNDTNIPHSITRDESPADSSSYGRSRLASSSSSAASAALDAVGVPDDRTAAGEEIRVTPRPSRPPSPRRPPRAPVVSFIFILHCVCTHLGSAQYLHGHGRLMTAFSTGCRCWTRSVGQVTIHVAYRTQP